MSRNKLKISNFSKFLVIFLLFYFPLETNAKSAKHHKDDLEVVKTSLDECSEAVSDLLLLLKPYATPTTTQSAVENVMSDIEALSNNDWGISIEETLTNINTIAEDIDDDMENENYAKMLSNETEILNILIQEGIDTPRDVRNSDVDYLIRRATYTQELVDDVDSDVSDEYDKYDKQRKVTISLSTLGAVIVLFLVLVMFIIYMKNKKKDDDSDSSSSSSDGHSNPLSSVDDPRSQESLFLSSQERFEIPRATSSYLKSGQPSTSQESSSLRRDDERPSQERY